MRPPATTPGWLRASGPLVIDQTDHEVADVGPTLTRGATECAAIASEIARRWNAYPDLLAFVERVATRVHETADDMNPRGMTEEARDVLTRATGGSK